jgi:hypothetical protein
MSYAPETWELFATLQPNKEQEILIKSQKFWVIILATTISASLSHPYLL